jgi:hypothetical protein
MEENAYRRARARLLAAIGRLSELNAAAAESRSTTDVRAAQVEVEAATRAVRVLEAEMLREDKSK